MPRPARSRSPPSFAWVTLARQVVGLDRLDRRADSPVVEPDGLATPGLGDGAGEGARDGGRRYDPAVLVELRLAAQHGRPGHLQHVPALEQQSLLAAGDARQRGDKRLLLPLAPHAEQRPVGDVGRGARFGHAEGARLPDDQERAARLPGVAEHDGVADAQPRDEAAGQRERGGRGHVARDDRQAAAHAEDDDRRRHDPAHAIPDRAPPHDGGTWFDRAGAELGAAKVHQDLAREAKLPRRPADVSRHLRPVGRGVVRAVDARAVHPAADQLRDEVRVRGRLGGHRDHDSRGSLARLVPEERPRVPGDDLGAFVQSHRGLAPGGGVRLPPPALGLRPGTLGPTAVAHRPQQVDDRVDVGQDGRLAVAQRGHAGGREPPLQAPHVVAAEGHVVNEVPGAGAIGRVDPLERLDEAALELLQLGSQLRELGDERGVGGPARGRLPRHNRANLRTPRQATAGG